MSYSRQKIIKTLLERKLYYAIAIFITLAIGIGSLVTLKGVMVQPVKLLSDKVIHAVAYGILSISWLLALKFELKTQKSKIWLLLAIVGYGIIIEVLQGVFTNYRQADTFDILANFVGITVGFVFFSLVLQKKQVN